MHKIHISKLLFEYISLLPAQQTWIPFLVSVGHLHRGAANPRAAPANAALCARARACAARTVPALLKLLTRWWCNAKTPLMIDMNFLTASLFLNPHINRTSRPRFSHREQTARMPAGFCRWHRNRDGSLPGGLPRSVLKGGTRGSVRHLRKDQQEERNDLFDCDLRREALAVAWRLPLGPARGCRLAALGSCAGGAYGEPGSGGRGATAAFPWAAERGTRAGFGVAAPADGAPAPHGAQSGPPPGCSAAAPGQGRRGAGPGRGSPWPGSGCRAGRPPRCAAGRASRSHRPPGCTGSSPASRRRAGAFRPRRCGTSSRASPGPAAPARPEPPSGRGAGLAQPEPGRVLNERPREPSGAPALAAAPLARSSLM